MIQSSIFYDEMWLDESTSNQDRTERINAFNNTDLFTLEYIGKGKTTMAGPYYLVKRKEVRQILLLKALFRLDNHIIN